MLDQRRDATPLTANQRSVCADLMERYGWSEDRAIAAARTAQL